MASTRDEDDYTGMRQAIQAQLSDLCHTVRNEEIA
jgi:hypothetical protein